MFAISNLCSVGKNVTTVFKPKNVIRQQFWWPVRTATVSLKFENVVPGCCVYLSYLICCSQDCFTVVLEAIISASTRVRVIF